MLGLATYFCAVVADDFDEEPSLDLKKIESVFTGKVEEEKEQDCQKNNPKKPDVFQNRICILEKKIQDICTETAQCSLTPLTATSRPQICGQGFFLFANALYWRIFEGGTDYAITNVTQFGTEQSNIALEPSAPRRANFHWSWGYRVGAAYYLPHDEWDLRFTFTRYQTKAHDFFQDIKQHNVGALYGPAIANIFAQASELNAKIKYTTLNLGIGRGFFLNHDIALHPFAAVKAAWISQRTHLVFTQTSPLIPLNLQSTIPGNSKNDFSGIGPETGIDIQMFFNSHWSFFGQFSAALLYGKFDVHFDLTSISDFATLKLFDIQANTHRLSPTVQTLFGFGWETDFQNNEWYFATYIGYELQVWWRQNQQISFDNFHSWLRFAEDLTLHGLTVDVRLDF